MDKDRIVLGAVQTQNKKTIPAPKSLLSKYKAKDNRWVRTNRGVEGNNATVGQRDRQ